MSKWSRGEALRIFIAKFMARDSAKASGVTAPEVLDAVETGAGAYMEAQLITERAVRPQQSPSPNRP